MKKGESIMAETRYDAIVVVGGHNGLVGNLLSHARAGNRVLDVLTCRAGFALVGR